MHPTAHPTDISSLVSVRFSSAVEGVDPIDGDALVATRHRFQAVVVQQDAEDTTFLDSDGGVVGRWPTTRIEEVSWSPGSSIRIVVNTPSRLRKIRETYPRAYERWTAEEDQQLSEEFTAGLTVDDLVERHGRARGGLLARLEHLGLVPDEAPAGATL